MFDFDKPSTEVSLLNFAVKRMQHACTRLSGLTDNFKTPYEELPEAYKVFATLLTTEYQTALALLKEMNAISTGRSLANLHPDATTYMEEVFYQSQRVVVTDIDLHIKLNKARDASEIWIAHQHATKRLHEDEKRMLKEAGIHPQDNDQEAAA
jgi:hypothetical protein